jgi:hypothetical protein
LAGEVKVKEKIHSVRYERGDITLKQVAKAVFASARGRFGEALSYLQGEGMLVARDADGKLVAGIGGGDDMEIIVSQDQAREPVKETPRPPVISDDALVLQQPMTVRSSPLSLKKSP